MSGDWRARLDARIGRCARCGGWVFGLTVCPTCIARASESCKVVA